MLDDIENNNQITSNIHRIKRMKTGRPTTANNNRLDSNKEFINNLKKGNLDIQTFSYKDKEIEVN